MSVEEASGDEQEVNEVTRGKRWGNNSGNYNQNALISIIIATAVTNINNSDLRKTDKSNCGHKSKGRENHLDSGI